MGKEWERKFAAPKDVQQAIAEDSQIRALAADTQTLRMESRYFDTPSGELAAKKLTLRLRKENGRGVVTFKTPIAEGLRGEWEYEAETLEGAAEKLAVLGAPVVPWGELIEVCGALFTRTAMALVFPDGAKAGLALDLGVLQGGGKTLPLAEVEVEHKGGDLQTIEAFCVLLADKYHLRGEPRSKYLRARMLKEGKP